jgi:hypothetical protein
MNKKVITVLQIVIPAVTIAAVAPIEVFYYATQRCTDEVPDTTSLYVYTVDREFAELNQRYAKAMGIEPKAKDRLITYESIPEISSWDEVKYIYIFSDAACDAADEDYKAGKNVKLAVPSDVMFYYGDCSGMWSMFGDEVKNDDRSHHGEYMVFDTAEDSFKKGYEEPDYFFYYKYDPSTWDSFMTELNAYLIENDASSDISMLITTRSKPDASNLQMKLMYEFPASNYDSAHYSKVWKESYNKEVGMKIALPSVCFAVFLICFEILFARLKKPRKTKE